MEEKSSSVTGTASAMRVVAAGAASVLCVIATGAASALRVVAAVAASVVCLVRICRVSSGTMPLNTMGSLSFSRSARSEEAEAKLSDIPAFVCECVDVCECTDVEETLLLSR